MNFNFIKMIAHNELYYIILHPLVIIVGVILLLLAFINGYGGGSMIDESYFKNGQDSFMQGYNQILYYTIFISNIMAAFLGVISVAKDRWAHSMNVLLTKPIYRRDVLLGKFTGICEFLFIFVGLVLLFTTIMLILCFKEPLSYSELFCRFLSYVIVLSMECSLVAALAMFVGTFFKNILGPVTIIITYIYVEWFWYLAERMGSFSIFTPRMLFLKIINPVNGGNMDELFNTLVPFTQWLGNAMPYILLLLFVTLAVLLINLYLFTKLEDV